MPIYTRAVGVLRHVGWWTIPRRGKRAPRKTFNFFSGRLAGCGMRTIITVSTTRETAQQTRRRTMRQHSEKCYYAKKNRYTVIAFTSPAGREYWQRAFAPCGGGETITRKEAIALVGRESVEFARANAKNYREGVDFTK